jgi:hypothetical protein
MSHLEQITPEEMPEVTKIANRLYEQEREQQEQAQERQAYLSAAEEMEIPQEYLERAAEELSLQRIARIRQRRRLRQAAVATFGGILIVGGFWRITHPPIVKPTPMVFTAQQWRLDANPETKAEVTFQNWEGRNSVAVIHVEQFVPRARDGQYFVNLNSQKVPTDLRATQSVSFFVKGNGLPNLRLYLEASPTERWRSPALPVTSEWQKQTLNLQQFEYQTRASTNAPWQSTSTRPPDRIENLSFKTGTFINESTAKGEIGVEGVEFE